jgi:histidinol phosphatase-like PHP family hydrolase
MYNLHTHTILSDGVLVASEVAVRYKVAGYKTIAITDHTDYSNIDANIEAVLKFCSRWPRESGITVLPGVELTHVPPAQFLPLTEYARAKGIKVVIGHGETPVEPMTPGTNRAAILAGVDILAHPGRIADEDAIFAQQKGVFLEVTSRKGHNLTNEHVVTTAKKYGTPLILNIDGHSPDDIISPQQLRQVGINAGLSAQEVDELYRRVEAFIATKEA